MGVVGELYHCAPLWVKNDINAVFALLSDNLSTILLFIVLLRTPTGNSLEYSNEFIYEYVVPGTAIGLLWGNLWFFILARLLSVSTGRKDVTSLPYGINTPTMYAFYFSILQPLSSGGDLHKAYFTTVAANFICGAIITLSAAIAPFIQKHTPPIALISSVAGIAMAYLVIANVGLALSEPLAGVVSIVIVMIGTYGLKECGQIGPIPIVVIAVVWGSSICWMQGGCSSGSHVGQTGKDLKDSIVHVTWQGVPFPLKSIFHYMGDAIKHQIAIIFPLALQTIAGTISSVEIAKKAGDNYDIKRCMVIDGMGTMISALCGSPLSLCTFPNHPGYRKLGGRVGYSWAFAILYLIMGLFGVLSPFLSIFAIHSIAPSIIFVGLMITTEALDLCETRHYAAFIFGIIPCLATWGKPKGSHKEVGLEFLSAGDLIVGLLWSAILYFLAERHFHRAALWSFFASVLSFIGLIHTFPNSLGFKVGRDEFGWKFSIAYLQVALVFGLCYLGQKKDLIPPSRRLSVRETLERRDTAFGEILQKDKGSCVYHDMSPSSKINIVHSQ